MNHQELKIIEEETRKQMQHEDPLFSDSTSERIRQSLYQNKFIRLLHWVFGK